MMILSEGYLFVFTKFLQIFLWISLPALFIAMLVTTIMHYKNKKKLKLVKKADGTIEDSKRDVEQIMMPLPIGSTSELMHQLSYSNAKCIALRKDFESLEEKYSTLLTGLKQISETSKLDSMEKLQKELQQTLQEQIDNINQQHEAEKKELQAQIIELNEVLDNLQNENTGLREQLALHSSDETEVSAVITKWEDQKTELKRKLGEQEYLKDVLEEKRYYIDFLQKQLEQRIKNHHLVEQQFRDLGVKFLEVKDEMERREQSDEQYKNDVEGKDKEIRSLQEIILAKTVHTTQLEATVANIEEQNTKLTTEVENKEQKIKSLKEQLDNANELHSQMEERLEKSQQLIRGFHRKLSDIIDTTEEPPVVMMKSVYQSSEENRLTETAIP